ncbi:tRNA(Ile)-lysidine synthase TilS/MesJ [Hypnocyclicus thermotrophus]|uniref:tRNA(Ile)-lysidine synthase TilS/MesJ n=1 Tax=Hypnocyclicus thermotrophus TaxID=1627895 RepID=A0AA46DYM1_9FUSO|nr:ATP-binding protein [Hypnocyclicus thermotrophus]TDT70532.1 tRNA(Ile)-lysidine synthase TilS/MesJ [Hypnocyclicus thermotrophus]
MNIIYINDFYELNDKTVNEYNFKIDNNTLIIKNKNLFKLTFDLTKNSRIKILQNIRKTCNINIWFNKLTSREALEYIESNGFNKTLLNMSGKAMHKYNMIEDGDRIAIGVSGGKDSLTLINILYRVKQISNINFDIIPIHIHPNTDTSNTLHIKKYIESLRLKLKIIETDLEKFLFEEGNIKNPCFLCGRIRRGILYTYLKENNINKLALGHHKDDIIETYLMNIFYQGNTHSMRPSYFAKEYEIQVIRPLAFVEESTTIKYSKKINLPILKSSCPYETSDNSRRLKIKNLIKELSIDNPDIRSSILNALKSDKKI